MSNETLLEAGILLDYHGRQERVQGFKLTIGARVYGSDQKIIDLVQHTPKRDKGPQLKPALNLMLPGGDVERHSLHQHLDPSQGAPTGTEDDDNRVAFSGSIPEGDMPKVVTYERIQFKQATANNGKRRAAQQYFSLAVEAYAVILGPQGTEEVRVAITKSSPVVVRGRSPGHYSDNPSATSSDAPASTSAPRNTVESQQQTQSQQQQPLTTSTAFLRNEQPSPTSLKSTPIIQGIPPPSQPQSNTTPQSLPHSTSTMPLHDQTHPDNNNSTVANMDTDFGESLEADFDGYQYFPSTLLDPHGKVVVPHDLFYDPHEFPDTHYANLLFGMDPNTANQFGNETGGMATNAIGSGTNDNGNGGNGTDMFPNLYQGFFDFPIQPSDLSWNAMARGPSQQGTSGPTSGQGGSPFPKDRLPVPSNTAQQQPMENPNWFDNAFGSQGSQTLLPNFRSNSNSSPFNFGLGADAPGNGGAGGNGGGNGNGNGGKWMFEFRNSSYGYFPNIPAVGDMHST
jgi:NDT80 / PhoG like DNA-binding  family